jgi:FkbM family methyltransferase
LHQRRGTISTIGRIARGRTSISSARVVAFEANPYTYRLFANQNTQFEYLHLALSDSIGPVTFHVHRDAEGAPIANGQGSLLRRDKITADHERGFHEVTVEATTLDAFFAGSQFRRAALWIDSEGGLKFILPGTREVLRRTALMLVEVEDQNFWGADHWLREHVVSYLYDLGFVPVARDFEFIHQYNIVFVRSELLTGATRMRLALARFVSRAYDARLSTRTGARAAVAPWHREASKRIVNALRKGRRVLQSRP